MTDFVILGFKTEYKGDRAVDWVEIAPAGEAFERTRTWLRIKDITPKPDAERSDSLSHKVMVARWQTIAPKYEAWKQGNEIPEDGTPLAAWAGVTPAQVSHLRQMGIYTVENVRDMGEGAISRMPFPNARQLPKLAADFLTSRDAAEKDRELEDMRERMAIMEEMLAQQSEKRGPGRPRKQEEAA